MFLNNLLNKLLYLELFIASGALAYAVTDELQIKYVFDDTEKYVLIVVITFLIFRVIGKLVDLVNLEEK